MIVKLIKMIYICIFISDRQFKIEIQQHGSVLIIYFIICSAAVIVWALLSVCTCCMFSYENTVTKHRNEMFLTSIIIKSACRFQYRSSLKLIRHANIKFCTETGANRTPESVDTVTVTPATHHTILSDEIVRTLTAGDENLVKRLKLIEFEYEVSKQDGMRAPSGLSLEQWKELLQLPSLSKRRKYLTFLFKLEMIKMNKKQKKVEDKMRKEAERASEKEEEKESDRPEHIQYGLGKNTIFLKIYDTKIDQYHNSKMLTASIFDQPIVYDLSYDQNMTSAEQRNAAKQLLLTLVSNREHIQPLPIQLCNVNFNSPVMKHLAKMIPTLYNPEFPIGISHKSYLDMYERQRIVYLTPHCQTELVEYDPDSVYIVGCLVDKCDTKPHSLAKAKRENVRMAKLPLDRYLTFGGGSGKSLTLNAMLSILVELRMHGDWNRALRHVPRRKLADDNDPQLSDPFNKTVIQVEQKIF